jgi:hypothetical protein
VPVSPAASYLSPFAREEEGNGIGQAVGIGLFIAFLVLTLIFSDVSIRPVW